VIQKLSFSLGLSVFGRGCFAGAAVDKFVLIGLVGSESVGLKDVQTQVGIGFLGGVEFARVAFVTVLAWELAEL